MSTQPTQPPNVYDLDYRMRQVVADIQTHEAQLSGHTNSLATVLAGLNRQRTYLKMLLVCKATLLMPTRLDNYVNMLCALYKPPGQLPPDMDKDTTPAWVIADAVVAETNDHDRNNYADIFKYVYGYAPTLFFATNN